MIEKEDEMDFHDIPNGASRNIPYNNGQPHNCLDTGRCLNGAEIERRIADRASIRELKDILLRIEPKVNMMWGWKYVILATFGIITAGLFYLSQGNTQGIKTAAEESMRRDREIALEWRAAIRRIESSQDSLRQENQHLSDISRTISLNLKHFMEKQGFRYQEPEIDHSHAPSPSVLEDYYDE